MKMMKNWKRFWTLDRHHAEGFTLVELIVVIAILAILAGVAVPAYSGYINEANKTSDQTLISDVARAMTMHYYTSAVVEGGFVVLTRDGVAITADEQADAFGVAAMEAAFGDNWKETTVLKYEWNANIAGSSASTIAPTQLTSSVTSLTGLAAAVVGSNDPEKATTIIAFLAGDNAELKAELEQYEDDPNYDTIASNLLVKYVSDELKDMNSGEAGNEPSWVSNTALQYAMIYSMANSDDPYSEDAKRELAKFDEALEMIAEKEAEDAVGTSVQNEIMGALSDMLNAKFTDDEGNDVRFEDAFSDYAESSAGVADFEGVVDAMGFVNSVSNGYVDRDTLANEGLYGSDEVVNLLSDYQKANQYGVVVRISSDGVITVLPTEANLAE